MGVTGLAAVLLAIAVLLVVVSAVQPLAQRLHLPHALPLCHRAMRRATAAARERRRGTAGRLPSLAGD